MIIIPNSYSRLYYAQRVSPVHREKEKKREKTSRAVRFCHARYRSQSLRLKPFRLFIPLLPLIENAVYGSQMASWRGDSQLNLSPGSFGWLMPAPSWLTFAGWPSVCCRRDP